MNTSVVRILALMILAAYVGGRAETAIVPAAGQPKAETGNSVGTMPAQPALRDELLAMKEEDQRVRKAAGPTMTDRQREEWMQVDARNQIRMEAIIAEHGWPGISLVGADGAGAAWLLVQHFSPAFQEKCLPLLENAVSTGQAAGRNYAYLLDRVRMHQGKPQIYGTQFRTSNGTTAAHPIEDPDHLDERRRAIGLGPWADYEKQILKGAAAREAVVGNPDLRQEIFRMAVESQQVRMGGLANQSDAQKAERKRVDAVHRGRLQEIFSKHGWPGRSLIGADASAMILQLVMQQDASFRSECLPLLEQAMKSVEVPADYYARLVDLVRLDEGRPLVYGTIPWLRGQDGKQILPVIEDPERVDERRRAIGLEPLKR